MWSKTVLVFLGAAALAASAVAQTKTSGTAQCKADPSAPVEVGDKPGHSLAVGKGQCAWSSFEIAGVSYKDGVSVSMDEINGDKSTSNGYHTATLANGDKTTARFHGTTTTKDGKFVSGGGTWTFVAAPASARASRAGEPTRARRMPTGPWRIKLTASTRCRNNAALAPHYARFLSVARYCEPAVFLAGRIPVTPSDPVPEAASRTTGCASPS